MSIKAGNRSTWARRVVSAVAAGTSVLTLASCQNGNAPEAATAPSAETSVVDCVNSIPVQARALGAAVELTQALRATPSQPCQDAVDAAVVSLSRQMMRNVFTGEKVDNYLKAHGTVISVVSPEKMRELTNGLNAGALATGNSIIVSRSSLDDPRHLAVILAHEGTHIFDGTERLFEGGAETAPLRESLGLAYPPNPEISGPDGDWSMATEGHAAYVAAFVAQEIGYEEQTDAFHPDGTPRSWDETLAASRANPGIRRRVGLPPLKKAIPDEVDVSVNAAQCRTMALDERIASTLSGYSIGLGYPVDRVSSAQGLARAQAFLCTYTMQKKAFEQARALLSTSATGQKALQTIDSAGLRFSLLDDDAFEQAYGKGDAIRINDTLFFRQRLLQNLDELSARIVYEATIAAAEVPPQWTMPPLPADLPEGMADFQEVFRLHAYARLKSEEYLTELSGVVTTPAWPQIANETWHDTALKTFIGF